MEDVLIIRFADDSPKLSVIGSERIIENAIDGGKLLLPFEFWGHYDWLRDSSNEIVGARWYPFHIEFPVNLEAFFDKMMQLPYCTLDARVILTVCFREGVSFLEERSQDQILDSSSVVWFHDPEGFFGLLLNDPPSGITGK